MCFCFSPPCPLSCLFFFVLSTFILCAKGVCDSLIALWPCFTAIDCTQTHRLELYSWNYDRKPIYVYQLPPEVTQVVLSDHLMLSATGGPHGQVLVTSNHLSGTSQEADVAVMRCVACVGCCGREKGGEEDKRKKRKEKWLRVYQPCFVDIFLPTSLFVCAQRTLWFLPVDSLSVVLTECEGFAEPLAHAGV